MSAVAKYREAVRASDMPISKLALESGIGTKTIYTHLNQGKCPSLGNAEAVLNTLGYEILIVRRGERNEN